MKKNMSSALAFLAMAFFAAPSAQAQTETNAKTVSTVTAAQPLRSPVPALQLTSRAQR